MKTCHEWLRRWTGDDTWDAIVARAQVCDDGQPVEWVISAAAAPPIEDDAAVSLAMPASGESARIPHCLSVIDVLDFAAAGACCVRTSGNASTGRNERVLRSR